MQWCKTRQPFSKGPIMLGPASADRIRFDREVLPHLAAAYGLAYLLLRVRGEAEDATQDALLRAYRNFGQLRGAAAKPWLLAIVRNVCFRRLQERKRATNVISLDEALVSGSSAVHLESTFSQAPRSPEDEVIRAAEGSLVRQALATLTPVFREVLVLREFEDLSYSEIADVIGAPIGTVMSRLARARDALREAATRLTKEDDDNAV